MPAHRQRADKVATKIISAAQQEALGQTEPIVLESPAETLRRRLLLDQELPLSGPMSLGVRDLPTTPQWNADKHLDAGEPKDAPSSESASLTLSLIQSIQIGARNSREYQTAKEDVFRSALALDLEREAFRNTFAGLVSGGYDRNATADPAVEGLKSTEDFSATRKLTQGVEVTAKIALDLVKLLTQDHASALGLFADTTISIPLLRGAGKRIAREPLTQAEREVLYAIDDFERFKKSYAVSVARGFLSSLEDLQQIRNAEESYKRLIASTRRARRLADAGKIPEFQFDQAIQDELRARVRWLQSQQIQASNLDAFKILLGLPPDAEVALETQELEALRESRKTLIEEAQGMNYSEGIPPADAPVVIPELDQKNKGPFELDPKEAIRLALEHRLDLRAMQGRVEDAQRKVMVAADGFKPELTLLGSAQAGDRRDIATAGQDNAKLDPGQGQFSALLSLDLPIERTAERDAYRDSLISLDRAVRNLQQMEDGIKLDVRNGLRSLVEARESLQIQCQAAEVARKRVHSMDLLLQAGRAAIRDVLEAEEALLNAENAVTSSLVRYRTAEWELQRDLGVLQVGVTGIWQEYTTEGE